jgi:hypothetical protein
VYFNRVFLRVTKDFLDIKARLCIFIESIQMKHKNKHIDTDPFVSFLKEHQYGPDGKLIDYKIVDDPENLSGFQIICEFQESATPEYTQRVKKELTGIIIDICNQANIEQPEII